MDDFLKTPNILDGLFKKPLNFNNITPVATLHRVDNRMEDVIAAVQKTNEEKIEKEAKRDAVQIGIHEQTKLLNEKLNSIGFSMDLLVDTINHQANLTAAEQVKMNEFLIDFKRAVTEDGDEKESRIKKVLLGGLNAGSKVALPLFVEYIKYEARKIGMQI